MSPHDPTLFIPGPTEVFPEVLAALTRPMISHRGPEIAEITEEIFANLKKVFLTEAECFVATSAATGLMEAAVRNLSAKKVLCTVCGAFSERQHQVACKNGKHAARLEADHGSTIDPAAVERELATGDYDLVTVVHSETSTGVLNPVREIAEVVRKFDDVLVAVDCVSSLAGAPVRFDEWGLDLAFAGTQKCMAMPPGLCLFAVSERAMARAADVEDRGHYFDFLSYRKMAQRSQCPATTSISLMFALQLQLRRILDEGLEARWARHAAMADLVRSRLRDRFELFPRTDLMTPSESVFRWQHERPITEIVDAVRKKGKLFGAGYGPLKSETFRIGHMGDLQPEHVGRFLDVFDETLSELQI